jgi:hypothetical protein
MPAARQREWAQFWDVAMVRTVGVEGVTDVESTKAQGSAEIWAPHFELRNDDSSGPNFRHVSSRFFFIGCELLLSRLRPNSMS